MTGDTRTQLLDRAQWLVQERGFNAFSFKDLAKAVGIRTPSVHHHFETKMDLAQALMERYIAELESLLAELDGSRKGPRGCIAAFIESYRVTEAQGLACLCGSMATDVATLPSDVQELVGRYFARSEEWLVGQLKAGQKSSELSSAASAPDLAAMLVAALQGALFLGRARGASSLKRVERAFWKLLDP